jgi:hypothetical protein
MEERRKTFLELSDRKGITSLMLKEVNQSGKLTITQENADGLAEHYRKRLGLTANILSKISSKKPALPVEQQPAQFTLPLDPSKVVPGPGWQMTPDGSHVFKSENCDSSIMHLKTAQCGKGLLSFTITSMEKNKKPILKLNGRKILAIPGSHEVRNIEIALPNLRRGTNILEFASSTTDAVSDEKAISSFCVKNLNFVPPGRGIPSFAFYVNLRRLLRSGLFFTSYYHEQVPETTSPAEHYLLYGAWEKKNPNHLFDSAYYLDRYRDVYLAGVNPLLHYIQWGWHEGKDPHPEFSTKQYLESYPEVAGSGMNPLFHYLKYGAISGARISPSSFRL